MKIALSTVPLAALIAFPLVLSIFATATLAQAPPIFGISIVNYESNVTQKPGTTAMYFAEVENTGILELDPIYVSASKLPEGWLKPHESMALKFGERGKLYYDITIPETQTGYIVYSLDVYGEYGQLKASDSKPVMITITNETAPTNATAVTNITETTTTTLAEETTTTTTTIVPALTVTTVEIPITNVTMPQLPELPELELVIAYVDTVKGKLECAWENWPLQMVALGLFVLAVILAIIRFWVI